MVADGERELVNTGFVLLQKGLAPRRVTRCAMTRYSPASSGDRRSSSDVAWCRLIFLRAEEYEASTNGTGPHVDQQLFSFMTSVPRVPVPMYPDVAVRC